ncbi:hypothetical protein A7U60_g4239 [Sanghuangporus baumii]|uniref:Uncharacterized protein n=1 Tax=Sanghuangporus baumii TaxID=108892 RepID=A0A9Q5HZD4_SANBA|nr:hypothetical protein A7U60_g4239 [Sanghuangporus baumii]
METSLAFQHCQTCARAYMVLYEIYFTVCHATSETRDCQIKVQHHTQEALHANPPNPIIPKRHEELIVTTRTPRAADPITWRILGWYKPELHNSCPASTVQANLYLPRNANLDTKQLQLVLQRRIWQYIRDVRLPGKAWLVTRTQLHPPAELIQFMVCIGPYSTPTRHLNTDVRVVLTPFGPQDEQRRVTYRAAYIAPRATIPPGDGIDVIVEH